MIAYYCFLSYLLLSLDQYVMSELCWIECAVFKVYRKKERKEKNTIIYSQQYYSRLVHHGVIGATILVKYNEWLNLVWSPKVGDANDGDVVGIREFNLSLRGDSHCSWLNWTLTWASRQSFFMLTRFGRRNNTSELLNLESNTVAIRLKNFPPYFWWVETHFRFSFKIWTLDSEFEVKSLFASIQIIQKRSLDNE